ncbi:MAG TPA: hypothetical protein VM262_06345 [Acidimicrobiales bacterium]|nr:hypothetical protein [Acidimicrobiales bacterium]
MPWCEACSRFWTPPSMNQDGTCPECGSTLVNPAGIDAQPKAPWHFKLLVVAVVVYLGWRLVQMVGWIV